MAKDRVAFVQHSVHGTKSFNQEINEVLDSLGDVEIVDIDIFVYSIKNSPGDFICAKIWYRPINEMEEN